MITINDTALNDNQLIFVLRISLNGSTLRYATRAITLSGNVYSDSVLLRVDFSTLNSISKNIDIYNGGGVGSLSAFEFSLSNFSGAYISEFYPSTSKPYLTSRKVEVGFLWSGATTEGEITWINSYYINSVSVETNKITCLCIELSDIETIDLPYYEVQKDFDNEMSYFPNAPEENLGLPIPILYGDFTAGAFGGTGADIITRSNYAPLVCVGRTSLLYMGCSHPVFESAETVAVGGSQEHLFLYLSGVDSYINVVNAIADASTVNDVRYIIRMRDRAARLKGSLIIRLTDLSELSDIDDVENIVDTDATTTYNEIDAGEKVALRSLGSANVSDVGFLSSVEEDVGVYAYLSSDSVNARNWKIYYSNPSTTVSTGTNTTGSVSGTTPTSAPRHQFGDSTTAKIEASLPWSIDEILSLDYVIENTQVTPGEKIRVYCAYLYFTEIIVYNPTRPRSTRNNIGLRNV